MSDDEFSAVVTLIWWGAPPDMYGIRGELTEVQESVLFEGLGAPEISDEHSKFMFMLGKYSLESVLDDEDTEEGQAILAIKDHRIDKSRMVRLDGSNWPRYSVRAFSYFVG